LTLCTLLFHRFGGGKEEEVGFEGVAIQEWGNRTVLKKKRKGNTMRLSPRKLFVKKGGTAAVWGKKKEETKIVRLCGRKTALS